ALRSRGAARPGAGAAGKPWSADDVGWRGPRCGGDGHATRQEAPGRGIGSIRAARRARAAAARSRREGSRSDRRRARVGAHVRLRNRIEVMHGVNLDQLGRRDPAHYGGITLNELERRISDSAAELGLETRFFQTNHEGEFVEHLHRMAGLADGIVLNPGAWTHYSYAIRDALE